MLISEFSSCENINISSFQLLSNSQKNAKDLVWLICYLWAFLILAITKPTNEKAYT